MAITKRQLQVRQREKARELPKQFIASIGDRSGNVSAGGNDIYIRDLLSGQTVTAKNFVVPSTPGRLVLVERRGGDLYVVGFWRIYGTSESQSEIVPPHSHGYADGDADFVDGIRFTPLLILPYSAFLVQIFGGMVQRSDGTWLRVANQTLDLSAYQPAAGAVWAVVEVDDTGSISVSTSATQDTKELLTASNIPIVTGTPLAAIRLYDGQESIQRDPDGVNDFADLRLFAAPSPLNTLHNMLSDLQGGGEYLVGDEYYHLSHDQWEHLVKGLNADAYHTHTGVGTIYHNDLPDLQGGGEYLGLVEAYHLARDEWEHLARGLNADDYHTHAGSGSWDGDITDIDVASSTDIGEAIADDDQGIIYNTSGAAWVRFAWSRVKTYIQALTDTLYVALTGDQSVGGVKTFTSFPVTPSSAPTTDYQVANKAYVDDNNTGWELIIDTTLGSDAANIDIISIPGTYKHLKLLYSLRTDRAAASDRVKVIINNDTTASKYESILYYWYHTSTWGTLDPATTAEAQVTFVPGNTALANSFGGGFIEFYDYANTTNLKLFQTRGGQMQSTTIKPEIYDSMAVWRDTSAISRITLAPVNGANFKQNSRISLYGLK